MRLISALLFSLVFATVSHAEPAKPDAVKSKASEATKAPAKEEVSTPAAVVAPPPAAPALTKENVETIVRDYIKAHPELIVESVTNFQQQQQSKEIENARTSAKEQIAALNNDKNSPSIGAKDADVTVVEFFDYHCGYCKMQFAVLKELLAEDKKLRVVFKEFPIFGDKSTELSQIALGIHRISPDKYLAFHQKMMEAENADATLAWQVVKELGISEVSLKKEISSKEVEDMLAKNHELAQKMGIRGTPALFINGEPYLSAAKKEKLQELIADARKNIKK